MLCYFLLCNKASQPYVYTDPLPKRVRHMYTQIPFQSESAICIHRSPSFCTYFLLTTASHPTRSSQSAEQSSMGCTAVSH